MNPDDSFNLNKEEEDGMSADNVLNGSEIS